MTVKISRFTQSKFVSNDSGPEGHLLNVHGGSLGNAFGGVVLRLQGDPWDDLVDSWDLRSVVRLSGTGGGPARWTGSVVRGYQQGYFPEVDGSQCVLISGGGHDRRQCPEAGGFFKYTGAVQCPVGVLLLGGDERPPGPRTSAGPAGPVPPTPGP